MAMDKKKQKKTLHFFCKAVNYITSPMAPTMHWGAIVNKKHRLPGFSFVVNAHNATHRSK